MRLQLKIPAIGKVFFCWPFNGDFASRCMLDIEEQRQGKGGIETRFKTQF